MWQRAAQGLHGCRRRRNRSVLDSKSVLVCRRDKINHPLERLRYSTSEIVAPSGASCRAAVELRRACGSPEANLEFGKRGGPRQPRSSSQSVSYDESSLDLRVTHDTDPESGNSGPALMVVMVVASVVVGVVAALLYGTLFAGS
jgi:hypothetical protein